MKIISGFLAWIKDVLKKKVYRVTERKYFFTSWTKNHHFFYNALIKIHFSDSETGHGKLRQRTLPSQCPVRTANITQTVPNVSSHVP